MKKLLIVVDYQNDFVTGSLGFEKAVELEEPIAARIREYREMGEDGQIIFTMDTHDRHYMESQEGKHLPVAHCIEGEDGWQLYGKIADLKDDNDLVFSKHTFGSYELGEYLHKHSDEFESVERDFEYSRDQGGNAGSSHNCRCIMCRKQRPVS